MLKLAADENFRLSIVRGLRRRNPGLDIVRVQDAGLAGADDAVILAWAAEEGRILVTHDIATISDFAYERVLAGKAMPGVLKISRSLPIARAIEELLLVAGASHEGEWDGKVFYLPL
jgi:predicted nuclease of predicted toxin-antitoxin system